MPEEIVLLPILALAPLHLIALSKSWESTPAPKTTTTFPTTIRPIEINNIPIFHCAVSSTLHSLFIKQHITSLNNIKRLHCLHEIVQDSTRLTFFSPFSDVNNSPLPQCPVWLTNVRRLFRQRNVMPHKTLERERAQNEINKLYSHLFQSFVSVIFNHIITIIMKLKCLCGEHLRDNCFVVVVTGLQSADSSLFWNDEETNLIENGLFSGKQTSWIWISALSDILCLLMVSGLLMNNKSRKSTKISKYI